MLLCLQLRDIEILCQTPGLQSDKVLWHASHHQTLVISTSPELQVSNSR